MSTKGKTLQIIITVIVVTIIIFLLVRTLQAVSFSYTLTQDKYYTWGMDINSPYPASILSSIPLVSTDTGTRTSIKTITEHGFSIGDYIIISGAISTGIVYNGQWKIYSVPDTYTFVITKSYVTYTPPVNAVSCKRVLIPDGFIPTEASLIIKGLTQTGDNPTDSLYIHVIGDTGLNLLWKEFSNTEPGDYFALKNSRIIGNNGSTLPIIDDTFIQKFNDTVIGKQDVTINLSTINNPDSWVWKVFKSPFNFTLSNSTVKPFSSSLLVFIDYAGTGNVGIGLDPVGTGSFGFDRMYLEVTIETYTGALSTYEKRIIKVNLNTPPYISNDQ